LRISKASSVWIPDVAIGSRSAGLESAYVVPGAVSPQAVTSSLRALLDTRHHPIGRHRFTVLDTFDGRVRRSGARLSRGDAVGSSTLAWEPAGGRGALSVRLDCPVNFVWDLPDGPLQQAMAPVVGVRRLLEQAEAEEYGSELDILDGRQKTIARLRIASGEARLEPNGTWRPLPPILTLSGLRGYEREYERLRHVLASRPGVEACPEGPHGVILGRVGAPAHRDVSSFSVEQDPAVRAEAGVRQIHRALAAVLAANEPGLRANLDTEFLHDFRVAVRRTRSLLGQIRHVFPPDAVRHFSAGFSWIARLTGSPRDLDVLVLSLRDRRREFAPAEMDVVLSFLAGQQRIEHENLVRALDSERYRRLLVDWQAFLEESGGPGSAERHAGRSLAEAVSRRAWRLSRRIVRGAAGIDRRTAPSQVHEVRIAAKKLRYLIDVNPAFYESADLDTILGALKKLQRVLGDFNDADVQERRLLDCGRALGEARGTAGALLLLGRLAEASRRRREDLREQVSGRLAGFAARETQAACRRAFKRGRDREP
jgi:CHAD domain-containing protein